MIRKTLGWFIVAKETVIDKAFVKKRRPSFRPACEPVKPRSLADNLRALNRFFSTVENITLEANIVDFSFNSILTLMSQSHANPPRSYLKYAADQVVALIILSYCVGSVCELFWEAFVYEPSITSQHLPCPRNQNCVGGAKLDDPQFGINSADGSVTREIYIMAVEVGMKDAPSFKKFSVRSFNAFFRLKLVILPLILAPLQNSPGLCVALLVIYNVWSWGHTIYLLCRYRPFSGKIVSLYQVVLETSILIFSLGAFYLYIIRQYSMMDNLDQTASKLDLAITLSVLLSITLQLVRISLEIVEVLFASFCQKKLSRSAMKSARLQTYFASVYRNLQDNLLAGTQLQKIAPLKTYESHTSFNSARKTTSHTSNAILRTAPHDGNETDRTGLNLRNRNVREKVLLAQETNRNEFGSLSTRRIRAIPTARQNQPLILPGQYPILPPLLLPKPLKSGAFPRMPMVPMDMKPAVPYYQLMPQVSMPPKPSPRSLTTALTTRHKPPLPNQPPSTSNISQYKPQRSETVESVQVPEYSKVTEPSQSYTISAPPKQEQSSDNNRGLRIRLLKSRLLTQGALPHGPKIEFPRQPQVPARKPKQYNSMDFVTDTFLDGPATDKKYVSSDLMRPAEGSLITPPPPRSLNTYLTKLDTPRTPK